MDKHPRREELLGQLKLLNPDDGSNPNYQMMLEFAFDKVAQDVANYTHLAIAVLPVELDTVLLSLCQQFLATHQLLTPVADRDGDVKTLSEGDTSVTFKSIGEVYAELQSVNSLTDNYVAQLNSFRVVKR
ncbi:MULTISPECIES: hypothetical protein [Lactobacillaceae]|uniref:hypothetical protein n=1 Tax=Lactobacillaceae TaxID=33958 RepID=UPI0014570BEB|nr:hypothetical protein [Lactobacillus sp. HBUAS51381]NLR08670.1 hypothetical protein [Lactobacillus sp. HBUAS51381]